MPQLSSADHSSSPPIIDIPREYNAAYDLIERNLRAGRGAKLAYIDDHGSYTYADLAERVARCANALLGIGLHAEQRVMLCLQDTIDFPTAFLGSIKAGVVPIAINTLMKTADYDYVLRDSRARALIVSESLLPVFAPLLDSLPCLKHVIISSNGVGELASPPAPQENLRSDSAHSTLVHSFTALVSSAPSTSATAATSPDDACFWLYSSGSTGAPKGTIHAHASLIQTAELYARPILGIRADDIVFSAAKLFFAYGLGNALTFPLSVGATTVLMTERPTPEAVFARLRRYRPTIFYGVPTLYAALLSSTLPAPGELSLRTCVSAGEALPRETGERWVRHFGVDILDGLGSTEMLHIFLSNLAGDVCYGTTGLAVPGYELRLVDEEGKRVLPGEIGELQIAGPTRAMAYWNNREKTHGMFQGAWVRSGDKYLLDEHGRYVYCGRSDDMLKVSGMYVSPAEVEAALIAHPDVLEAAVVSKQDESGLTKPLAFVVLQPNVHATPALAAALKQHVKGLIAPFKYPRWIEFVPDLPKTATGKIQRFKLRGASTEPHVSDVTAVVR